MVTTSEPVSISPLSTGLFEGIEAYADRQQKLCIALVYPAHFVIRLEHLILYPVVSGITVMVAVGDSE